MRAQFFIVPFLLLACNNATEPVANEKTTPTAVPSALSANAKVYKHVALPNLDDNVRNDTLLIYTTHALGDGTFIMAAMNKSGTPEGLRLYLYEPRTDSSAHVIAFSKPGYDSMTMLPTYFSTSDTADGTVIITNMGEKQSWGQEAFWLKDRRFIPLGFLDVAKRDWKTEDDSTFQWRTSIADRVNVRGENGTFEFTFTGDSLQLYDDQQGQREVMLPARAISYQCSEGKATLLINGQAIQAKPL